jgi:hypothetical protein
MKDWDFTRRNESSVWITIIVSHEINTHLAVVRFLDAQAEVASILEGFDRFATATWNMNGAEAIAADKELFAHQESYLREARDLSAHDETARRWCAALTRAWKLQLSQGQEADTA